MQLKSSINRNPLSNSHLKSISMSYFVKLFSGKYRRFFLSNYDFKQKFLPSFCSLTFAQNSSASPPPPSAQHSASCAVPLPCLLYTSHPPFRTIGHSRLHVKNQKLRHYPQLQTETRFLRSNRRLPENLRSIYPRRHAQPYACLLYTSRCV